MRASQTQSVNDQIIPMGGARLFLLGGGGGKEGAGHVGADINHGRALDECMDNNWGGGKASARGAAAPLPVLYSLKKTKTTIVVNGNKWASLTETQIETIILAKTGEKRKRKYQKR